MSWYTRRAGQKLKDALTELKEQSPDERHSLADEIDLARLLAERSVRIYDATVIEGQGSDDLKASATAGLRASLNHVTDVVSKAARVHAVSNAVIELEHIDYIVQQVNRIIEEEVADVDKALADRVVERIAGIKLPEKRDEADADETARRIRESLSDMDNTIGGES
tara:strand:+ start:403 stop:900 length:498 start_codon:yes stop_codon:yes gene_type:complete